MRIMNQTPTSIIVAAITQAIVDHQLAPGAKLGEQKLADHFGVSRTLVRQALFRLSQKRLITMEPARGAFVAAPSPQEARQVFALRRLLELEMTRKFVSQVKPLQIKALRQHLKLERAALSGPDLTGRSEMLGDFHVVMANLMGDKVLAEVLGDLISRCALITLMYQSTDDAGHSVDEHEALVDAMAAGDVDTATALMAQHLDHVLDSLTWHKEKSGKPPLPASTWP